MDFEQVVFGRRSVRAFTDADVPDALVRRLIAYGHCAPSGGNLREWLFIVVRTPAQKRAVTDATYQRDNESNPPQRWIESAPVIIALCADHRPLMRRYGRRALDNLLYLDLSACAENMLLGAVNLGLASCYISGFRPRQMAEALSLPEYIEPVALLPVGYPKAAGAQRPHVAQEEVTFLERYRE